MINVLEFIEDHITTVEIIAFAVIVCLVIIRIIIKKCRGENVGITPVGVMNDLPGSVTGVNKYEDAPHAETKTKDD